MSADSPVKPLGISRIEKRLDAFDGLIDLTDMSTRPAHQQREMFLARALAAYTIKSIAGADPETAAKSVTDSFHDRGIDAIYFDPGSSRLFVVQSKWSKGIGWKEVGEFVDGVRRLISPDFESFAKNPKITARRSEIEAALYSSARIVLVTVHHGPDPADQSVRGRVDEITAAIDDGADLAESIHWHQQHLFDAMEQESAPPSITADLTFCNWGQIKDPYHAVFGMVQGAAIADLGMRYPQLAHQNLRELLHESDVNSAIRKTVGSEPHHFWYFNNGLTVICEDIQPTVMGRLSHELTVFRLRGIGLVNGAQTTGVLSEFFPNLSESERAKLWVQVRVIAVKNCPDGFAKRVTRYTNLQNAVALQDFVSLDPTQSRLVIDFAIQKKRYAIRSGQDPAPQDDAGCTLRETTSALACAMPDLRFAVQRKRYITSLWQNEERYYKELFPSDITVTKVWNSVVIMREAVKVITECGSSGSAKAEMLANHLQWLLTHLVFQSDQLSGWETVNDPKTLLEAVREISRDLFERMRQLILKSHDQEYLASLSKNEDKCKELVGQLTEKPEARTDLFSHIPRGKNGNKSGS